MSGEDKQLPEPWTKKLAKALAEHALKTVLGVVIIAILGWTALYLGGQFDVIRCGVMQWFGLAYCGPPAQ